MSDEGRAAHDASAAVMVEVNAALAPLGIGIARTAIGAAVRYTVLRMPAGEAATPVYYGPHACERCGRMIVKAAIEAGGQAFDPPPALLRVFRRGSEAGNVDVCYPATWRPHTCAAADVDAWAQMSAKIVEVPPDVTAALGPTTSKERDGRSAKRLMKMRRSYRPETAR